MYAATCEPENEIKIDEFEYSLVVLNIDELDINFYPREKVDSDRIKLFAELIEEGEVFPEISVIRSDKSYFILDGVHRYEALKSLKKISAQVRLYKNIPQRNWLLLSAALNLKSSKPLSKEEIKNVVIKAYYNKMTKTEIGKIIGYSKSTIDRILSPYVKKDKQNDKKEVIELNKQGVAPKEIAKQTGINKRNVYRWIQQETDPLVEAKVVLNDIAVSHGATFNKTEQDVFLCLELVKSDKPVDVIVDMLGVSESWIRVTVVGFIYVYYHNSYRSLEPNEVENYFDMAESKANMILFLFDFKSNRPDRKLLLKWFNENPPKYRDNKTTRIIRDEKLYWHCILSNLPQRWEKGNGDIDKIINEMPPDVIRNIRDSISKVDQIEVIVNKKKYNQKIITEILESMNMLLISVNCTIMDLRKSI